MTEISNEIIERYFGIGSTLDLQTGIIGINLNNLPGISNLKNSLGASIVSFDSSEQSFKGTIDLSKSLNSSGIYSSKFEVSVNDSQEYETLAQFYIDKTKGQALEDYLDLEVQVNVLKVVDNLEIAPLNFSTFTETDPTKIQEQVFAYKNFSHVFNLESGTEYILEATSNYPINLTFDFNPKEDTRDPSSGSGGR